MTRLDEVGEAEWRGKKINALTRRELYGVIADMHDALDSVTGRNRELEWIRFGGRK